VAHLAEGLLAVLRVVDGHREDDLLDVGGDGGEVHLDLLVVALALTGEVVTRVLDGAVGALEVVEEDEVGIAADLARAVQQQGAGVEVEVGAGRGTDVPPQSDDDGGEARRLLAQRYVAALAEADSHESSIGVRGRVAPWCVGCRINESILVTGSRGSHSPRMNYRVSRAATYSFRSRASGRPLTTVQRTTPSWSMTKLPRTAQPLASSKTP